jgi:hypothetical protein
MFQMAHTKYLRELLLVGVYVLGILGIVASGGGGGGGGGGGVSSDPLSPTLSDFDIDPDTAAAGLTLDIFGSFRFTDSDGNLDGGSLNYTYDGSTFSIPLPAALAGLTEGGLNFTATIILNSSTGVIVVPVWLEDNSGRKSNVENIEFTQLWTRQFGTVLEDIGYSISSDSSDNIIVGGITFGDLDGETNLGGVDAFITKYNTDTSRAWTRLLGSSGADYGHAVAVDKNDNFYLAGYTLGALFDGMATSGGSDGFLSKFDSSGNRLWTRLIGTTEPDEALALAIDSADNIYVGGSTRGDLNGETNTLFSDAFVVKYDSSGNLLWTRLLGTNGGETVKDLGLDSSDNLYLVGQTDGVLGIDPSPGDPSVNFDVFVAKFNPSGSLQWVTQLGTSCTELAGGLAVSDISIIYISGKIRQCAFPGNSAFGRNDAFVGALDIDGNSQWIRQFGTDNDDSARDIAADSIGNAYVTGYLDSVYFTGDNEGNDIFLAKYDSSGSQLFRVVQENSISGGNQGLSIVSDNTDSIFITGTSEEHLDGHQNPNFGEDDAFILKFDTSGIKR